MLGAPCAHIHFFFSQTPRRCRSQYRKANGIKERYPQVVYIFFKPHTYSPSLSEENIHQTTRPKKVARPLPVYSPTRSRYKYLPRMGYPISLRLCSSPTLPSTSRLTAENKSSKNVLIFFREALCTTICFTSLQYANRSTQKPY